MIGNWFLAYQIEKGNLRTLLANGSLNAGYFLYCLLEGSSRDLYEGIEGSDLVGSWVIWMRG